MKKGFFALLVAQISFVVLLAAAVLAVYFNSNFRFNEYYLTYTRINGSIIWASVLLLIIIGFILGFYRKRLEKGKANMGKLPGVICFFKNKEAVIADVACGVFLLSSAVLLTLDTLGYFLYGGQIFVFISLSLFIISFGLHCILNGKNYRYFKEYGRKKR